MEPIPTGDPGLGNRPLGALALITTAVFYFTARYLAILILCLGQVERAHTGGEVTWKPVGTSWVNCGLWIIFPPMYPPITFWVHLDFDLNICPACTNQITFKMLPEMDPKYSCDMPSHTQG